VAVTLKGVRPYTARDKVQAAGPRRVLVHNHVQPAAQSGRRGFRAWEDDPSDRYVACACGWCPELGAHHRVAAVE
jgi:hypothetical protein